MKRLVSLALVLCLILTMAPAVMAETTAEAAVPQSEFYGELAEKYADSDIEHRTEVRWWMAEGGHTDETLLEEVQAMYDAGFRGVELCQLDVSGLDETQWGLGSEQWNHDFHLVVNKALDLGMTVGITSGTNWNTTNVPGLNPDSQAAMQTVFELNEKFEAGTKLEGHVIPTSKTESSGCGGTTVIPLREVNSWIGAYAYPVVEQASPVILGEPINVTEFVTANADGALTLNWTVPEDGAYYVFYYWMQGSAQESNPSAQPAYCVNYFDIRGFEAWKEFFQNTVLNDPELNAKIKEGDVQVFMDSLEFNHGDGITFFTEDFAEIFQARKGYDIRPYLMLAEGLPELTTFAPTPNDYGTFNLEDADLAYRILNDLHDVQTDLYTENLLVPMENWLNEYGIELRAQISYGRYIEISEPSMYVDYPEAENLNQRDQVDTYRLWSGAAKLENKILSSETGATFSMQYAFDHQTHLKEAYSLYAAGFSRINWHIWTSAWAPTNVWTAGGGWGGAQDWPGYSNLVVCNIVGLREPGYNEYWELNQHLGRVQELLREGKSRSDVGMPYMKYNQEIPFSTTKEEDMWMHRHDYMFFPSMELQENGYTYDYFSPEFLNSDKVYYDAENGTLELAGYKALVLWQDWLTIDGAQKVLELAKQGLKVVIVDGAAVKTPYNGGDAELAAVMAELKEEATVSCVATADDVLEALQAMGVEPYAAFESQQLLTQVREDEGNLYLYAYNYCNGVMHDGDDEDHGLVAIEEIAMDGTFIPYYIDAWTGEVTQVADYRWEDGKTIFELTLEYNDVALYAFEAVETEPEHIVATELDSYVTEDGIVLRATESGVYETELAYGRKVRTEVEVPAAYDITGWNLTVEAWEKGDYVERRDEVNGVANVENTYATKKTNIENIKLDKLTTWDNIPEVGKGVSGRGFYSAKFNWDGKADGAYLDFGSLINSMKVTINGVQTEDVNMNTPVLDISDYLVEGENTIELAYSSNLTNEMLETGRISEADSYEGYMPLWGSYEVHYRPYGPAQALIVPYVEETVEILASNDVTVSVNAAAEAVINSEAAFEIAVSGAEALATATLTVETNGLTDAAIVPAEGWTVFAQTEEDGALTVVMGNVNGVNGDAVIATVTGTVEKIGAATVEVTEATLSAYVGEGETFVNAILGAAGETAVVYSPYDVNQDGTVNQLDITRAQRFFGKPDDLADVNDDGTVDITDFVLILNNYSK